MSIGLSRILGCTVKKGFGPALVEAMKARGIPSHGALARAAGLSQPQVSRVISEERLNITADTYFALCRGLGVPCDHFAEFMDGSPATTPPTEKTPSPSVADTTGATPPPLPPIAKPRRPKPGRS